MRIRKSALAILCALGLVAATAPLASAHEPTEDSFKGRRSHSGTEHVSPGGVPLDSPIFDKDCENGLAGIFPCQNVDLDAFLPLGMIGASFVNDVWGWEEDGRQFAIAGTWEGTAFVEVTDGDSPIYLGTLPSAASAVAPYPEGFSGADVFGNLWGDIRVHEGVAYIGSEAFNFATGVGHGIQLFDLDRLLDADGPQTWTADGKLGNYSSHNLSLNEESEVLYVVGASDGVTECDTGGGGPIAYDVSDALSPELIGCVPQDGYTHDIQCVDYDGPDDDYDDAEICIAANEDTLTILDLSNFIEGQGDPVIVDKLTYLDLPFEPEGGGPPNYYTHQGWLSEDHDVFFLGDELDEFFGGIGPRTTYIFDLEDLDNASLIAGHTTGNSSIDHNMFVHDDLLYQSNYSDGLAILDTDNAKQGDLELIGNFDTFPADDITDFFGSWGNYPFFGDGKVIVTSSDEGLFVLDADDVDDDDDDDDDDDRNQHRNEHDDDDDDDHQRKGRRNRR